MKDYTFRDYYISEHMMAALLRYINNGIRPGSFLTAVLENDLSNAVACADDNNLPNLLAFVGYLYNEAPGLCWGSPATVKAWIAKGGAEQKAEAA